MILESFSRPKARDFSVPSDDVLLHVPGRITGVFDGASDSLGRRVGGTPIGRLAASAAAAAAAALPPEAADWPANDILARLSAVVGEKVQTNDGEGPASTTALIVFERPGSVRIVGIGDTGYRIDGGEAKVSELAPDRISIPARIALFSHFTEQGLSAAECETASRRCIGDGLVNSVRAGFLPGRVAERIRLAVAADLDSDAHDPAIELLNGGLRVQHRFANNPQSPLGYGVLNGQAPDTRQAIDLEVSIERISTIEIFSDGYLVAPEETSVEAWEACHARIETDDAHKLTLAPAIKGSTDTQVFDDRTLAILRLGQPPRRA